MINLIVFDDLVTELLMTRLIIIFFICLSSVSTVVANEWVVRDAEIMGTTIHTEVWNEDAELAREVADLVLATMHEVNQRMSPYIESSELSIINRKAAVQPLPISNQLKTVIETALHYSDITQGAFDITFASVGYLYNYRASQRPTEKQIEHSLEAVNFQNIILESTDKDSNIYFNHDNLRIDLGGIAKGYAVDLAIERAKQLGVDQIIVTAGGDSRILGDRNGRPWVIGIRHPLDKNKVIAKIPLVNEALSTSGDYERYFDEDGVRYHHIIDPKTGDSARAVRSVTIIGPRAIDTDALSTSVFVLGPEDGFALIESLPEIEGIVIDQAANLLFSSGLLDVE